MKPDVSEAWTVQYLEQHLHQVRDTRHEINDLALYSPLRCIHDLLFASVISVLLSSFWVKLFTYIMIRIVKYIFECYFIIVLSMDQV